MSCLKSLLLAGLLSASAAAAGPSPTLLLDNFDAEAPENALGGITGAWGDPDDKSQGATAVKDDKVRLGAMGRSLRLDYDIQSQRENTYVPSNYSVANPARAMNEAFNGYYSIFPPQDLRPYSYMVLWAKGDQEKGYSRTFKVEIKDGQSPFYRGYLVEGVGPEWRRFVIPLREFTDIKDWTNIKEFVIVFAADTVNRKTGTLYVDEIFFAKSPANNITLPAREGVIGRAEKPIAVDGKLKEWPRKAFFDLTKDASLESGARADAKDAGLRYALRWDPEFLYVAVELDDNQLLNGEQGENIWKGDCVEIYFSPTGPDFTWGSPQHFQLGISPASASAQPSIWAWFQKRAPAAGEVKAVWDKKSAEIAIAWKFLGVSPSVNKEFGFSLGYHDKDTDATPDAKLQWSYQNVAEGKARLGKVVLK